MKKILILSFSAFISSVYALDMRDNCTLNGTDSGASLSQCNRSYRNPMITLQDNLYRGRNLLSETAIKNATIMPIEQIAKSIDLKKTTFYQKQNNQATYDLDYQIMKNSINITNFENNIIQRENK